MPFNKSDAVPGFVPELGKSGDVPESESFNKMLGLSIDTASLNRDMIRMDVPGFGVISESDGFNISPG